MAGKPTVTSYAGRTVQTKPDWMGRPVWVWSDDGTVSQTLVYDTALNGKGKLTSSSDGPVTTRYTYGGQGNRLDSLITTLPVQGVPQSFTQTFGFDIYGNRTAGTTSHGGWTQSYHLAAGLPNQLRYGTAAVASTPWTSYDAVSWALLDIGYGNGVHSAFSYDKDQARLTGVTHGPNNSPFAKWTYTWDQDTGNLSRENDQLTGGFDQYMYDELNRLVAAVVQSPTYGEQLQQFDYDAFGNRTSSNLMRVAAWSGAKGASNASTTVSGLTNVATNQVVNAAFAQGSSALLQNRLPATTATGVPTGAVYDAQGNLTQVFEKPTSVSPAVVSMTYDALGRVLSVASTRTGITERYQYTAEGLRTGVQEYSGATLIRTRVNVYNDQRQLVAQYEKAAAGALTWKRDILYLGTREAAEIDAAGMHVTMVDHLGSPRVVVGPSGTVEARQKFLPFGELLEQSGTFKTAKGYTNHEQTDSSGLIYMQARFYLPGFGRFTAPDPARDQHFDNTQSWNIYSYVQNNPVMNIDPNGMELVEAEFAYNKVRVQNAGTTGSKVYIDKDMVKGLKALVAYAKKNGLTIRINSSFRSSEGQKKEAETNKNATKSTSYHEAGLAVDITLFKETTVKDKSGKDKTTESKDEITSDHGVVKDSKDNGLSWGGEWKTNPEAWHFENHVDTKEKDKKAQENDKQWKEKKDDIKKEKID